jgi:hypothetical protein
LGDTTSRKTWSGATTVTGHRGAKVDALPIDRLKVLLASRR